MMLSFEYAKYVGIVDVFIVIGFIVSIILGIKKGFLTKIIGIASGICGLLFALLFCVKFANGVLYPWFGTDLQNHFYTNIMANETFANMTSESAVDVMSSLGIPSFIANLILNNSASSAEEFAQSVATNLANLATTASLIVISFIILFFGTTIIFFLLKLLVKLLRTSKFVRVVDGILGLVLYSVLFYIILQVIFFVIIIIYNKAGLTGFNEFVQYDILGQEASFRLSQWFFMNNFFGNLIGLLF